MHHFRSTLITTASPPLTETSGGTLTTPELLTIEQAAEYLSIAPGTLYNWRHTGRVHLPPAVRLGGSLRYRRRDLDRFIAEQLEAA